MARKRMFGQRTWRFSDAGTKFDGRPRPARRSTLKPISPALKRGVVHCTRCGSRVVSNVSNCPFCGRSLRPVYARFWFWIIVVIAFAIAVVALVNLNLPQESTEPSSPAEPDRPQVIGAEVDSPLKDLPLQTAIDNSGLEVTVKSVSLGPVASNGAQIYIVEVDFENQTDESGFLYSTQWRLELSDGTRLDTFVGLAADGATISSNFADYELAAYGHFTGQLCFAVEQPVPVESEEGLEAEVITLIPSAVVFQPTALAYSEELLVTWKIPAPEAAS